AAPDPGRQRRDPSRRRDLEDHRSDREGSSRECDQPSEPVPHDGRDGPGGRDVQLGAGSGSSAAADPGGVALDPRAVSSLSAAFAEMAESAYDHEALVREAMGHAADAIQAFDAESYPPLIQPLDEWLQEHFRQAVAHPFGARHRGLWAWF